MSAGLPIEHGGAALELLPERALLRPDRGELLVADVHLGKAAAFRRAGRPLPRGTTGRELARLDALLERTGARRLTVLGDLFHDSVELDGPTAARVRAWLDARRPALEVLLVRGNHDRHAAALIDALDLAAAPEPLDAAPLLYRHHPADPARPPHLAGHIHPGVRLDDGLDRLKLPVFWRRGPSLVLPAFGAFTGLQILEPEPADEAWAATPTGVVPLPTAPTRQS